VRRREAAPQVTHLEDGGDYHQQRRRAALGVEEVDLLEHEFLGVWG